MEGVEAVNRKPTYEDLAKQVKALEEENRLTGEALTRLGYEVRFAGDGAAGIEFYREALQADRPFCAVIPKPYRIEERGELLSRVINLLVFT